MSAGDKVTLVQYRTLRPVQAEEGATYGGTLGVNLFKSPGVLLKLSDLASSTPGQASGLDTTDDLDEGQFNLWFTNLRAQNAVGSILENTGNVTLTYDSAGHTIKADLTDVAPTAGGMLQKTAFDAKGRLSEQDAATTGDLVEGYNLYYTDDRAGAAASALVAASTLDGTELVAVVQSGDPVQATAAAIAHVLLLGLVNAVDDAAAATAGVGVGYPYRNGSILQIRVI